METRILKVVRQGEAFNVQSPKSETGQVFQEILATDIVKINHQ